MRGLELTLLSERNGSLVLLVHGAHDPSVEEWEAAMDDTSDAMAENEGRCRMLVFTAGGKPSAPQRARALARGWANNLRSPVAVVTDNRLVRGVITVFAWFGLNVRPVRPDNLEEAFTHLELTSAEREWVLRRRDELDAELGLVRSVRRAG